MRYHPRGTARCVFIHGGYGVAAAQKLVELLVRVQLPVATPDAEPCSATEKPQGALEKVHDRVGQKTHICD